jgi:protein-L-isoaspartate(D-aspartate) O-methyltransferase
MTDYRRLCEEMIATIRSFGVTDERIFEAMRRIPRHFFAPGFDEQSYGDSPLPIGEQQTISQPFTVAFMMEHLELKVGQRVLEIGAGSGWSSALMQHIVGKEGQVIAVERIPNLVHLAKENLAKVSSKAQVVHSDGSAGFKPFAPYDRIVVTAAAPKIPEPLIEQLKVGGILVVPVGRLIQQMMKVRKDEDGIKTESLGSFRFVPLIGRHGFGLRE